LPSFLRPDIFISSIFDTIHSLIRDFH